MRTLSRIFGSLVGLFVEDGWLALSIIIVVAVAGLVAVASPTGSVAPGVVLLAGCLGVLFGNVMRSRRRT